MKQTLLVSAFILVVVAALAVGGYWARRKAGGPGLAKDSEPIWTSVSDSVGDGEEPWMLSSWRMSRGSAVHAKRETLPDGVVRITIEDSSIFSGDTVIIDVESGPEGTIQATARMNWSRDFGPPFKGSNDLPTGSVMVSSADIAGAHPLAIEYDLHGVGEDASTCEHGLVLVP
jgi:hypothetical protein